ncbi:FeoA family protein [Ramlibacter sp. H39-3-26]|uniref:FeoA family protein n=1 Tax=Curvibacter soli TaxID=3031331 RepID=UPI0023DCD1A0|nr:FeoA family protein [Ramlibacter sp. H39-3-26]MDF1486333.1 FeoA family protein [Ramlibacter sp. H39-3-26]
MISAATPTPHAAAVAPISLDALPRNAQATIVAMRPASPGEQSEIALRLLEIGFVPGERVRVIAHGFPGREPIAVRVGGHATFALRRYEAALVQVQPLPEGA